MAKLPKELEQSFSALNEKLDEIEKLVLPLFRENRAKINQRLSKFDQAKLNIVLAYSLNSLFYMYLRTQGISPMNHPVKDELERIKVYINKIKTINGEARENEKPSTSIDVAAANRFIKHALTTGANAQNSSDTTNNQPVKNLGKRKPNFESKNQAPFKKKRGKK
eukprot:TRINITY_DN7044_c0_g1_i1.p1 TRINITY_DN7044_c0_g1~~TRINITY_DN7044_c0_g1_i1.p1  ORF type:complete len:165 (-),score=32.24 TRINITY_DN7044_c0_g1_i1:10-504(-)